MLVEIDSLTCSTTPTQLTLENTQLLESARLHPGLAHINVFVESIASTRARRSGGKTRICAFALHTRKLAIRPQ